MDQSPLDFMTEGFKDASIEELRAYLGRFGISGSQQLVKMGTLSGGLKSRVIF